MRIAGDHTSESSKAIDVRVNKSEVLKPGQLLKLEGGKAVKADALETGAVLGVCLEYHSGVPDMVNKRSDGEYVRAACSPTAVYACKAPVITADAAAENSVSSSDLAAGFAEGCFVGAKLKRVSDGEVFDVTAYASQAMTIEGSVNEGDEFEVYLPDGFIGGALNEDADKLVLTEHCENFVLRACGYDMDRGEVWFMPVLHEYK